MTDQGRLWPAEPVTTAEDFRPVQYLGSKVRVLEEIERTLDEIEPAGGTAVDLFSGSGVVAARLARTRPVVAVDVQEYARVLASALLNPAALRPATIVDAAAELAGDLAQTASAALIDCERRARWALDRGDPEPFSAIVDYGALVVHETGETPPPGALADALGTTALPAWATLTRHYGGVYFGYEQALRLDCLLSLVRDLPEGPPRDTALAAVLGAASECVTSVGNHFAQPVRPRDAHGRIKIAVVRAAARRRERDPLALCAHRLQRYAVLPPATEGSRALCADFRQFLSGGRARVDAVYADPPYTRDHYSRFYHVLETMARGDEPHVSHVTVNGVTSLSRGLYRRERHQSPFCIRSEVSSAFRSLFTGVRALDAPLVLSYSPSANGTPARPKPRLMTIPDIIAIAKESFAEVSVRPAGAVRHSKFNAARLNADADPNAEAFLVCVP